MSVTPSALRHSDERLFDFETLDCYRAALELQAVLPELGSRSGHALRDQLERAAASIVLNLAEGCGRSGRERARYYAIARGSAMESAAAVALIAARNRAPLVACRRARALLMRIVCMLSRLERRARKRLREQAISAPSGAARARARGGL